MGSQRIVLPPDVRVQDITGVHYRVKARKRRWARDTEQIQMLVDAHVPTIIVSNMEFDFIFKFILFFIIISDQL